MCNVYGWCELTIVCPFSARRRWKKNAVPLLAHSRRGYFLTNFVRLSRVFRLTDSPWSPKHDTRTRYMKRVNDAQKSKRELLEFVRMTTGTIAAASAHKQKRGFHSVLGPRLRRRELCFAFWVVVDNGRQVRRTTNDSLVVCVCYILVRVAQVVVDVWWQW